MNKQYKKNELIRELLQASTVSELQELSAYSKSREATRYH